MENKIRTSKTMATIASKTMSGRLDDAYIEMLVNNLLTEVDDQKLFIEELAKSLAASVLSNRRA